MFMTGVLCTVYGAQVYLVFGGVFVLSLAMSLLDFSPRIPLGTFSILLLIFPNRTGQVPGGVSASVPCWYATPVANTM